MAVQITFWNFVKKINSTARPASAGNALTGTLKSPCSMMTPEVELNFDPKDYNYFRIVEWQRFYFITDIIHEDGIWTVRGRVDPLASFKDYIGNSFQYVTRSANSSNGEIIDTFYPALANGQTQTQQVSMGFNYVGTFVVGIAGAGTSGTTGGGTIYYELSSAQMSSLVTWLYTDTNYSAAAGALDETNKFYFNPLQYIVAVLWYPFTWSGDSSQATTIKIGWWDTGITANRAYPFHVLTDVTITIPKHPLSGTRGNYLNAEPYSRYRLYVPGAGEIALNSMVLSQVTQIIVGGTVDTITGKVFYNVYAGSTSKLMTRLEGNLGVPIALSQVTVNTIGAMLDTATAAATTIATAGLFAGSSVGNALESNTPTVSRTGSDGSRSVSVTNGNAILFHEYMLTASADDTDFGRPLCARMQISSLSGFTKCMLPHIAINGTRTEAEEIETMMEGGFFYE